MTGRIRRIVASFLILCMGAVSIPAPAFAGIVSTEQALAGAERERLAGLLERDDVQARLQALGVDPADARARVAALSDAGTDQDLEDGGMDASPDTASPASGCLPSGWAPSPRCRAWCCWTGCWPTASAATAARSPRSG